MGFKLKLNIWAKLVIICTVTMNSIFPAKGDGNCYRCSEGELKDGTKVGKPCAKLTDSVKVEACDIYPGMINYCAMSTLTAEIEYGSGILGGTSTVEKVVARHCLPLPLKQYELSTGCFEMDSLDAVALGITIPEPPGAPPGVPVKVTKMTNIKSCICLKDECNNKEGHVASVDEACSAVGLVRGIDKFNSFVLVTMFLFWFFFTQ